MEGIGDSSGCGSLESGLLVGEEGETTAVTIELRCKVLYVEGLQ